MVQPEGVLYGDNSDRRANFDNLLHSFLANYLLHVGAAVGDH